MGCWSGEGDASFRERLREFRIIKTHAPLKRGGGERLELPEDVFYRSI
jgi:hypothetical protein